MNNTFCSPFNPDAARWSGMSSMSQMTGNPLSLQSNIPRQGLAQSMTPPVSMGAIHNASASMQNHMNPSSSMSMYSPPYGMPPTCDSPLGNSMIGSPMSSAGGILNGCQVGDSCDTWRGSSIASLRQKALEHSAGLAGMNVFR